MGQTNVNKDGLAHGDTNSDGKFLRSNNGAAPSWETVDQTTIPVADEDTDATSFPVFTTGATGDQAPKTNEDKLTFNASSGRLSATSLSVISTGGSVRAFGAASGGGVTDSAFLDANGVTISGTVGGPCELRFQVSNVSTFVGFKAPTSGAGQIWELPPTDGAANTYLKTSGAGVLSWSSIVNADVDAAAAIAGTKISPDFGSQDIVTTGSCTANALVGRHGRAPANIQGGTYTLHVTDAGKIVRAGGNVTIDQNVFSEGDMLVVYNDTAGDITLIQGTSFTLRLAGDAATGTRTIAQRGVCTVFNLAANEAVVGGVGVS